MIINIVPAQRAGVQTVVRRIRSGGDDCAVKLRMVADKDVIAAVARKQPALVTNAGVLAVYLAFAEAQPGRTARAPGEAEAAAGALLFALIVISVLQAGEREVIACVDADAVAQRLRAGEQHVVAAAERQVILRVNAAVDVGRAVAVLTAAGHIAAGLYAEARFFADGGMHPCAPAGRFVAAFLFGVVAGGDQIQVVCGGQRDVVANGTGALTLGGTILLQLMFRGFLNASLSKRVLARC